MAVDESDIERVRERVSIARNQLGRAIAAARMLPETPHWRGSSHTLAMSQQDDLLRELQRLDGAFGELAYRCDQDLQHLRRQREQEGLTGADW